MKKITTILTVVCILMAFNVKADNNNKNNDNKNCSTTTMGDWRVGIWNRDVNENLILVNYEALPIISSAYKTTTPFACGLTFGYQHKMRPSIIHNRFSFGYGGHIGVIRYFGADVKTKFIGNNDEQTVDSYKSYTYIPVLLEFNLYYNFSRSNLFLSVEAGCNLMLGQKDCHLSDGGIVRQINDSTISVNNGDRVISVQKDANKVSLTRAIPTGRASLGYMYELNQDFRIRVQAGIEYEMKYKDSFSGYYNDVDAGYIESFHKGDQPATITPFVSIGLAYSL